MKRFGLFLLVTMAAAIFTSCNDSDGDYPRLSAFASVKPLENNDFYVVLDDGKTVYPGDKSRIGSYKAEEDQRVVIYFNLLNNKGKDTITTWRSITYRTSTRAARKS